VVVGEQTRERPGLCEGTALERYRRIRRFTEQLCKPLGPEDCVIQSMPDASPTRWHLAHTTWFFETFVLARALDRFRPHEPAFAYLFNSYYNSVGDQFPRSERGLLSRPTLEEVYAYRGAVDEQMEELVDQGAAAERLEELLPVIELGLHHEQQHQELILTDIKHVFSRNPLCPVYHSIDAQRPPASSRPDWVGYKGGLHWFGHEGEGFAYDNELPRHRHFVEPFELASRLTTNGEYLEFVQDGGYREPKLWLSDGWAQVERNGWSAPLYWVRRDDGWWEFTLSGLRRLEPAEPVCHVSYFEADAFARWSGAWLPFESAWELAARRTSSSGHFAEEGVFHPQPAREEEGIPAQMLGDLWEWTCSPYAPYPGYKVPEGALGEYNGKFMCNQYVLRGGSCATPESHIRTTYRNFFPPEARWQFTGIRLVR
jgi:ergothioneine biosynthesis protein EgtB